MGRETESRCRGVGGNGRIGWYRCIGRGVRRSHGRSRQRGLRRIRRVCDLDRNDQRRTKRLSGLSPETPRAHIRAGLSGGNQTDGYLGPFIGFDNPAQSRRITAHLVSSDEYKAVLQRPVARSVVANLPDLGERFSRPDHRSGWDRFIANQKQVVAPGGKREGIYRGCQ